MATEIFACTSQFLSSTLVILSLFVLTLTISIGNNVILSAIWCLKARVNFQNNRIARVCRASEI